MMTNMFERMTVEEFSAFCNKDVTVKYIEKINGQNITKERIGRIENITCYQSNCLRENFPYEEYLTLSFSLIDKENTEHKLFTINVIDIQIKNNMP